MKKKFKKKLDKREKLFKKQKKERGWSDDELWSLDNTLAKLILPRLKRFRKISSGFPYSETETQETWYEKIDKMIFAFEFYSKDVLDILSKKDYKKVDQGLNLFAKYYGNLWF